MPIQSAVQGHPRWLCDDASDINFPFTVDISINLLRLLPLTCFSVPLPIVEQHFTFPKSSRLAHRRDIGALVTGGKAFNSFPLRVVSREVSYEEGSPVRLVISVPKRLFKRAVDRNLLKRRIREAFRLNRAVLADALAAQHKSIHLMVVFTGKEASSFDLIQSKIILILQRLKGIHAQDSLDVNGRPADLL